MGLLGFSIWFFRGTCCLPWGDNLWCFVKFWNRFCAWTRYFWWGGLWRHDKCSHWDSVNFVASLYLNWQNRYMLSLFSFFCRLSLCHSIFLWGWVCVDGSGGEAWQRTKTRCQHASFCAIGGQQPGPVEPGSRERSRELLKQAFNDGRTFFKWG